MAEETNSEIQEMLDRVVGDEPAASETEEPKTETETKVEEPEKEDPLQTRVKELESQLAGQSAEISILREIAIKQPAPAQATEEEPDVDIVEFEKKLRVAPGATIVETVKQIAAKVAKQTREETIREIQGRNQQRDALQEDRDSTLREFPEIMEDAALQQEASVEFERLKKMHGGALPGDMYSAVSAAVAKRAKAGKVTMGKQNGRRQIVDTGTRSTGGTDEERPESEFKPHELAAIDATCKKFGMTREQYLTRFSAHRKTDRTFGRL